MRRKQRWNFSELFYIIFLLFFFFDFSNSRGRGQSGGPIVGPFQHRDAGTAAQLENLGGDHELSGEQQRRLPKGVHRLRPARVGEA